jgi:hypothetical protein
VSDGSLRSIAEHLALAMRPLREAVADVEAFEALLLRLGWEAESIPASYQSLGSAASGAIAAIYALGDDATEAEIAAALEKNRAVYLSLRQVADAPPGVDAGAFVAEFGERLFELLLVDYLEAAAPTASSVLRMVDVIHLEDHGATAGRPAFVRARLRLDEIPRVIAEPESIPARVYGWGTPDLDFPLLASHLSDVLYPLGFPAFVDHVDPELGEAFQPPVERTDRAISSLLHVPLFEVEVAGELVEAAVRVLELPAEDDKPPGLIIQPAIPPQVGTDVPVGDNLAFHVRAGSDLARTFGIVVRPGEIAVRYPFQPGAELPTAGFGIALVLTALSPRALLGESAGTRLQVAGVMAELDVDVRADGVELRASVVLNDLRLVVAAGDQDGFLADLLGGDLSIPIPLEIQWSSRTGLTFSGSPGITVRSYPHLKVGPVRLEELALTVDGGPGGTPALRLTATLVLTGMLGPVEFVLEGVGIGTQLLFADGNVGPFDVSVGFKPPDGVGLVIDAGPVKGGGFLRFEPERGTYSGALELVVGRLEVKAFGILTTRTDGYSLIIVMSAEFPEPITLPFGWRLAGVGGLIGIHHRLDVPALQTRLRDGSATPILFPSDPITAAPKILSTLATVFPAAKGQFLIGPLFRLFWGARGLATLSVAVILELPDPIRVLILGRLDVTAPHRGFELLVLRVDFAGVVDFERPSFELDAPIVDSRLGPFGLTGDVAVRMRGGEENLFLLTAGGFHPRFPVPTNANLPTLRRMAVALSSGDNPRARVEMYTAITSSTWQIGGKLEVSASKAGFTAEARLSVDAIFGEITVDGRTRCGFLAEIEGRAAIKRGGTTIAGVGLTITLTGTEPWHVSGKAKISFFFFSVSIPFEGTFGDEPARPELPLVDAAELLRAALEERASWETGLPSGARALVTLVSAPTDADEIVAHPLGRVAVRQHAIPLGVELTRVGGSRTTPDRYDVETVTVGAETPPITALRSPFAAGQYLDLGEDERFTRPAFEPMISGFELASRAATRGPDIAADLTYEEFTIGPDGRLEDRRPGRPALADVFLHAASLGAAATSVLRRDERPAATVPGGTIRVRDLAPVAVDPVTLRAIPVPGVLSAGTYTEVAQAVAGHIARGAAAPGDVVVVGAHEAVD